MKDVYLSDLLDRARALSALLRVMQDAAIDWHVRTLLERRARETAQDIANILERELCERGICS